MAVIVDFIREFSPWIYGACAVAALWYLRVVLLARSERRSSVFALEREQALNRVFGAWGAAFALSALMAGVYLLSTVVFAAVEPQLTAGQETPTPVAVAENAGTPTPSPTLPLPEITPTGTPTPRPRPTARPTQPAPVGPTPTAADAVRRPSCPDGRAAITQPGVGQVFSGPVTITGTAQHEAFDYYKLEYGAGASPNVWSYFDGGEAPVSGGRLGVLNMLPPGVYSIRIVVVDTSGNFPTPCQTTIEFR